MAKKNTVKQETEVVKAQEASEGFKASEFVVETKNELAKVVWPSRQQLISESVAVMLMVVLVSTFIYLINNFFAWGASKVFL